MLITLIAGWWGIAALLFRNPFAIVVNLWSLVRPPFAADELGAMNVNHIRDAAAPHENLADVYRSMPSWLETLDDDEIDIVIVDTDYYEVLGVDEQASQQRIKACWRQRVKERHPDVAGASQGASADMALLADAYRVLGDERLRHAYDHRHELADFLDGFRIRRRRPHRTTTISPGTRTAVACAWRRSSTSTPSLTTSTRNTLTPTTRTRLSRYEMGARSTRRPMGPEPRAEAGGAARSVRPTSTSMTTR